MNCTVPSFYFRELQLITILRLICEFNLRLIFTFYRL